MEDLILDPTVETVETVEEVAVEEVVIVEDVFIPEPAIEASQALGAVVNQPVLYDVADFTLKCYRCGTEEVLQPGVTNGLAIELYPTDQHELRLVCKSCGTCMKLYFNPSIKETPTDEPVLEESQITE